MVIELFLHLPKILYLQNKFLAAHLRLLTRAEAHQNVGQHLSQVNSELLTSWFDENNDRLLDSPFLAGNRLPNRSFTQKYLC